jgi:hypothetical protein
LSVNTGGSISGAANALRATIGGTTAAPGGTLAAIQVDTNFDSGVTLPGSASFIPGAEAAGRTNVGATSPLDVAAGAIRMGAESLAPSIFGNKGTQAYNETLARRQAESKQDEEKNFGATIAGRVAGSLGPGLLTGPAAVGQSALGTVGRSALLGGGMGAVAGAGEADSGKQLEGAASGALTGAFLGGVIPAALQARQVGREIGQGANSMIGRTPTVTERAKNVAFLRSQGVDVTPAQESGSRAGKYYESVLADLPLTGGRKAFEGQKGQFINAALKTIGEHGDTITPELVEGAAKRIGGVFNTVLARNDVEVNTTTKALINNALKQFDDIRTVETPNLFKRIMSSVDGWQKTPLSGKEYQQMRMSLGEMRAAGGEAGKVAAKVQDALDLALEKSARKAGNLDDAKMLAEARRQYKNFLPIQTAATRAGEGRATGQVSPSAIANAVVQQNPTAFARGRGDLAKLARAGSLLNEPPNSGTAGRTMMTALATGGLPAALATGGASLPVMAAGAALPTVLGRARFSNLSGAASPQAGLLGYLISQGLMPGARELTD